MTDIDKNASIPIQIEPADGFDRFYEYLKRQNAESKLEWEKLCSELFRDNDD